MAVPKDPEPTTGRRAGLRAAIRTATLGTLGLLGLASLIWGGYHALTNSADLLRRVEEVVLVVQGVDPYRDPDMTYPPTAPAVFVPLVAPLSGQPTALRAAWLIGNLAALGLAVGLILRTWGRGWPGAWRRAFALAAAASKPVRLTIGMGQFALIPMALVLLAFAAAQRRRAVVAGLMLGVALVKPTMVLPFLVVFAVRGRWRVVVVAVAFQASALAVVSGWLGIAPDDLVRGWLARAEGQRSAGLIDAPSVAARLWPAAAGVSGAISCAVLLLGAAWMVACRRASDLALLAFAGFVAAIMAYHRPYDLVLLLPALAMLLESACQAGRRGDRGAARALGAAAAVFAALLIAPAHPAVIAEATYDALFIPSAYGFLGLIAVRLLVEARRNRSQTAGRAAARQRPPARARTFPSGVPSGSPGLALAGPRGEA